MGSFLKVPGGEKESKAFRIFTYVCWAIEIACGLFICFGIPYAYSLWVAVHYGR
jgi:hypothetical protein